jgi:hypothetical protein
MARRDIDEVDPNKILLLAGLGLFIILTPLVTGGLKPADTTPLVQSFVQILAPPAQTVITVSHGLRHRVVPQTRAAPVQERFVAAPAIDVSMPMIVLPTPQLAGEPAEIGANSNAPVCRPPQRLPTSRLQGPQVCLPQQEWDRLKAQGLVASSYNKSRVSNPLTCTSMVTGASTATSWIVTCHQ